MHPSRQNDPEGPLPFLLDRLRSTFGPVGAWKRRDPVSELAWGILSAGTATPLAQEVFAQLKSRFYPWPRLAEARPDELTKLLAPLDEPGLKAELLPKALNAIRARTGALRLDWLQNLALEDAQAWLEELPGVTDVIAAGVLNLSTLQRPIFVTDRAAQRVLTRFGSASEEEGSGGVREAVMDLVPSDWSADKLSELHKLIGRLADTTCHSAQPDCGGCSLRPRCKARSARLSQRPTLSAANQNHAPGDRLDDYLRRRIQKLERDGVSTQTLLNAGVSWNCPEIDEAFVGGKLPAGVHQTAGEQIEDRAAALLPVFATAVARKNCGESLRLLVIQEADVIREYGELHGPGLQALGLDRPEVAFVRPRASATALEITDEALRCRAAPVVLLELRRGAALADLSATRRFNLMARRSGAFLFLVTPDLTGASAAVTRWNAATCASAGVKRRLGPPTIMLDLVRNRSGRLGRWTVEWVASERRLRSVRQAYRAGRQWTPAASERRPVEL